MLETVVWTGGRVRVDAVTLEKIRKFMDEANGELAHSVHTDSAMIETKLRYHACGFSTSGEGKHMRISGSVLLTRTNAPTIHWKVGGRRGTPPHDGTWLVS